MSMREMGRGRTDSITGWGDGEGKKGSRKEEIGAGSVYRYRLGDGEGRKGAGKRKWERGVSIGTDWVMGKGRRAAEIGNRIEESIGTDWVMGKGR